MKASGFPYVLPMLLLSVAFFATPLAVLVGFSFAGSGGATLEHYARFFGDAFNFRVLVNTARLGLETVIGTTLLGVPIALLYWHAGRHSIHRPGKLQPNAIGWPARDHLEQHAHIRCSGRRRRNRVRRSCRRSHQSDQGRAAVGSRSRDLALGAARRCKFGHLALDLSTGCGSVERHSFCARAPLRKSWLRKDDPISPMPGGFPSGRVLQSS